MSIIDSLKAWPKAKKITVAVIAGVVVAAVGVTAFLIHRNNILATTMRLLKVEGTVNIEDASGNVKPVIDNIRFQSGDTLSTGSDGLASIGLDDTKIVTLQNDSSAQFLKSGKQIELKLKQGGVFFEVTEKLSDDETYEIETSNMTVGIRGTSGYVWYDESGLQSLIITDGKVLVSGYNPQTGETKTVEVCGGQRVSCYLYSDITEDRTSIEFELTDVPAEELPEFPLQMLSENPELLEKVCNETGWDKDELLALVVALTDPNEPTPTPDEIIEITDTPTPTEKPKTIVTLTPTPTDTTTPSPSPSTKPLAAATGTPAPGSSTTTPTATPKITTTPSATPKPTTTVNPTSTPTVTPTATTTPTATPTVATYTVTFITNGKCTAPSTQTITEGGKATKPSTPSAEGYTFEGWCTDKNCTEAYDFASEVTSNLTLYAKWVRITYTVTFDTDGKATTEPMTVDFNGKATSPAEPESSVFIFDGWYEDPDCTISYDFDSIVTSNITIYAKWIGPDDTIPSGYTKDTTGILVYNTKLPWGSGPNAYGQTVYICYSLDENLTPEDDGYFLGWVDHEWVELKKDSYTVDYAVVDSYLYKGKYYYQLSYTKPNWTT